MTALAWPVVALVGLGTLVYLAQMVLARFDLARQVRADWKEATTAQLCNVADLEKRMRGLENKMAQIDTRTRRP